MASGEAKAESASAVLTPPGSSACCSQIQYSRLSVIRIPPFLPAVTDFPAFVIKAGGSHPPHAYTQKAPFFRPRALLPDSQPVIKTGHGYRLGSQNASRFLPSKPGRTRAPAPASIRNGARPRGIHRL